MSLPQSRRSARSPSCRSEGQSKTDQYGDDADAERETQLVAEHRRRDGDTHKRLKELDGGRNARWDGPQDAEP